MPGVGGVDGPLALSAQSFLAEQLVHGSASCVIAAAMMVPSVVTLVTPNVAPQFGQPMGFTPFGQINNLLTLQLGEQRLFEAIAQSPNMRVFFVDSVCRDLSCFPESYHRWDIVGASATAAFLRAAD